MPPIESTKMNNSFHMPTEARSRSRQGARGETGAQCGASQVAILTTPTCNAASSTPGTSPAANNFGIDCTAVSP